MTNKLPVVGKRYKPKNLNLRNFYKFEYETIAVTKKNIAVKIVRSDFKHLLETVKVYDINSIKNKLEELPEDKAETKLNCGLCGGNGKLTSLTIPPAEVDCYKCNTKPCEVEIKPETQSHISELSPEVKEAMEELKKILIKESDSMFFTVHQSEYTTEVLRLTCHAFSDKAKKLLNALDKQFKVNETSEFVEVKGEEIKENKIYWSDEKLSKCGRSKIKIGTNSTFEYKCNVEDKEESIWKPVNSLKTNELVPAGFVRMNKKYPATFSISQTTVKEWELTKEEFRSMEFCSIDEFFSDYEKLKERVKKLEEK